MIRAIRKIIARICRQPVARGFGIQSPWAYHMMIDVIASKQPCGDYERLSALHPDQGRQERRRNELLLRLSRRMNATGFIYSAGDEIAPFYVKAGSPQAVTMRAVSEIDVDKQPAILYRCDITHAMLSDIIEKVNPRSLLIVDGIRNDERCFSQWKELRSNPKCCVSFDLYDLALVFFDPKITRQHYLGPVY